MSCICLLRFVFQHIHHVESPTSETVIAIDLAFVTVQNFTSHFTVFQYQFQAYTETMNELFVGKLRTDEKFISHVIKASNVFIAREVI